MNVFYIYLIVINIVSFLVVLYDKNRAINEQFRVPEKVLFLLTLIGGSAGIFAGMRMLRHKSSKNSYKLTVSIIVMIQIVILYIFQK